MHTRLEETLFYPAVREVDEDLVLESYEEHDNVKAMLRNWQSLVQMTKRMMQK